MYYNEYRQNFSMNDKSYQNRLDECESRRRAGTLWFHGNVFYHTGKKIPLDYKGTKITEKQAAYIAEHGESKEIFYLNFARGGESKENFCVNRGRKSKRTYLGLINGTDEFGPISIKYHNVYRKVNKNAQT